MKPSGAMSRRVSSSVRSLGGIDGLRRSQVVVGEPLAALPDERPHPVKPRVQIGLVPGLRGRPARIVEDGQLLEERVVDAELSLAHQPDDHPSSSFCFSPGADLALELRQLLVHLPRGGELRQLAVELRLGRR